MAMPFQPWRAALQPASFAGAEFHVEVSGLNTGRRLAVHEYPKQDTPFTEDMGRKARRWPMTGYCIGPDYLDDRDALIAACETEGPATLVTPSLGAVEVHCEVCNPSESREKGGYCSFELVFVEAGQNPDASATDDTAAQSTAAAGTSNDTAASAGAAGLAGQGPVGGVGGINAGAGSGDITGGGYPSGIPTS